MNNLKRVLSLALSGIMLVGMMAIGAGAVNGKDFTDADKIQNSEAVNTLVTLNVINGKDDGSHYDPEGTLTRAEMAKLIVYILNGGKEPVLSTKATPTYSDIKGHWAEKYIEYCSNLGIIAGQGDGTFNPGGTLTGSQAAKMMMVAMNYDSNVFGFTGPDWELSVTSEANKAKLFEGLDNLVASDPINRDDAAQLVYNGMLANTMKLSYSQSLADGKVTQNYEPEGPTLFAEKFDGKRYEGVLTKSGKYALSGTGSSDYFTIAQTKIDNLDLDDSTTTPKKGAPETFKYEKQDLTPLMGESVKVLYNDRTKTVYGVYSVVENNTVLIKTTTNTVGDNTDDEIEIDDVKYSKDGDFKIYGTINDNYTDNLKVVDNDGDGKVDLAIVQKVGVAKVTFVGSDSVTLAKKGGTADLKASNQKTKDMIVYEGIKKDDFVIFTKDLYTDKDKVEKVELVEGSVSGIGGTDNKFQIDGKWYKKATNGDVYDIAVGDTLKMVALDNKLYYAEKVTGNQSVENVVMLITADKEDKVDAGRARLLFSDGTKKVVNVVSGDKGSDLLVDDNAGKLFTYDTNNSGEYELTAAANLGTKYTWHADGDLSGAPISKVASTDIADDAVVFMSALANGAKLDSSNNGKVITGKELKALAIDTTKATIAEATKGYYTSKSNGLTRASILCVTLGANATNFDDISGTSTNNYGYLVGDATYTKTSGTNYVVMKVWNGNETVDVKWATSGASENYKNYKKHTIIGYDTKGADEITNVVKIDDMEATDIRSALTNAAITGLDGKEISFNSETTVYKITGDTKILYVDSSASGSSMGVAESNLQLATEPVKGLFVENARYIGKKVGTSLEVEFIVYDVNNQLANRAKTTDITVPTGAKVIVGSSEYVAGDKVNIAVGDMVKVVAEKGKKITVTSSSNLITNFATTSLETVSTVAADAKSADAAVESKTFTVKTTAAVTITAE